MSKTTFLSIILIVLLLGIGLVALVKINPPKQIANLNVTQPVNLAETPAPVTTTPSSLSNVVAREQGLELKSFAPCLQMVNDLDRQNCLTNLRNLLMPSAESARFCLTLTDADQQYNCVKEFVTSKDKVAECSILPTEGQQNLCQADYAVSRAFFGNSAICDIIKDETKKSECLDQAYLNQAIKYGITENCSKITDESLRTSCTTQAW
jgi:hypothetical protein